MTPTNKRQTNWHAHIRTISLDRMVVIMSWRRHRRRWRNKASLASHSSPKGLNSACRYRETKSLCLCCLWPDNNNSHMVVALHPVAYKMMFVDNYEQIECKRQASVYGTGASPTPDNHADCAKSSRTGAKYDGSYILSKIARNWLKIKFDEPPSLAKLSFRFLEYALRRSEWILKILESNYFL